MTISIDSFLCLNRGLRGCFFSTCFFLSLLRNFSELSSVFFFLALSSILFEFSLCKYQISSNFLKISKHGVFLAGGICLDRFETIRVVEGEGGNRNGLEFIVSGDDARITDHWRGDGLSQTGHFHLIFLYNGLRFPFLGFILELLHHYSVALSQLALNA